MAGLHSVLHQGQQTWQPGGGGEGGRAGRGSVPPPPGAGAPFQPAVLCPCPPHAPAELSHVCPGQAPAPSCRRVDALRSVQGSGLCSHGRGEGHPPRTGLWPGLAPLELVHQTSQYGGDLHCLHPGSGAESAPHAPHPMLPLQPFLSPGSTAAGAPKRALQDLEFRPQEEMGCRDMGCG